MNIDIRNIIYDSPEYEVSVNLRNEVFRKPWGLDIRNDDLSSDKEVEMFGAYIGNKMIATIFLDEYSKDIVKIKSVAILEEYRGKGLGKYLMDYVENIARQRGYTKSILMGRVSAEKFYHKLGYKTISDPYDYKTIPHVDMEKNL
ncbi:GNAT family N-acetyltransferase [Wansuia hejianensis]|uniref:GNAT family N-acetyltransferase n=1 Tax=Wansuia hejianensis TaxID=2763667 RepID=A0A926IHU5_9FIRM|nr:GNAT family N-acetyltransferase [Wansuia hejianensis]MBC8591057.1 GNAT family N-acetyltransferase [Wansuia hejianensis]